MNFDHIHIDREAVEAKTAEKKDKSNSICLIQSNGHIYFYRNCFVAFKV